MFSILDNRALIWVLPDRPFKPLSAIQMLRKRSCRQMHQQADSLSIINMNDQMNMIAGNAISINRHPIALDADTQPFPVNIPIPGKLQQESPVVTPMSQVEGIPLPQIS
jgi:hypothetical protein